MSNTDLVKQRGITSEYKDDRGGGATIPSAVIGIVKNNIDTTRSGRIQVYIKRLGSSNPDNPAYWTTVRYLSPFFGYTPNTGSPGSAGTFVGNPNSYGFWATPPDINTEVVCVFLNGDPSQGFYIGSIPPAGLTHMTPAIGASNYVIPNGSEADSYGGAKTLPVGEYNNANKQQDNSLNPSQPRPVHSYQASVMFKQGLLRDPDRGPITSSSMRESPSRVFGISTPGRPIYQGGYTDEEFMSAAKDTNTPDSNFKTIGRRGGHSIVMDDGDVTGKDNLVRIRTANGHMILLNDKAQTLFIIHSNGQSYIELGKEGTIDMYASNSVNIRTKGDLNLHADRDVNIQANRNINLNAYDIGVESENNYSKFTGGESQEYVMGNHTLKADKGISMNAGAEIGVEGKDNAYVKGAKVLLNSGSAGLQPQKVKQMQKALHSDTFFDTQKGFAEAPAANPSIVTRAPAHTPWKDANKGVDVKVELAPTGAGSQEPSPDLTKINQAVDNVSNTTNNVNAATASTANVSASEAGSIDKSTAGGIVSQMASNATTGYTGEAVKNTAAVLQVGDTKIASVGQFGMSPDQLEQAGYLKPGSAQLINSNIQKGIPLATAMPSNLWSGKDGANDIGAFVNNAKTQQSAATTLVGKAETALKETGLITGKESPTQTAGLVMSAATSGMGPTLKLAATVTGGLGLKMPTTLPLTELNKLAGNPAQLIASGNMVAGLMDKAKTGVGAAINSVKGMVSGLFSKVTSTFKSLQANVPQKIGPGSGDAQTTETPASTENIDPYAGLTDQQIEKLGNADATDPFIRSRLGLPALGTTDSVNQVAGATVNSGIPSNIPGTAAIKSTISDISNSVSSTFSNNVASAGALMNKLQTNRLTSVAGLGLKPPQLDSLQSAISSVATLSPESLKLPVLAENTVDVKALAAQSKKLLGDPKIPPPIV